MNNNTPEIYVYYSSINGGINNLQIAKVGSKIFSSKKRLAEKYAKKWLLKSN
jgi:hypothetical protein